MLAVGLVIGLASVIISALLLFWHRQLKKYAAFKYTKPIPVLGNALSMPSDPHELVKYVIDVNEKCGPTFILWFGMRPVVFSADVDVAEALLSSREYITKSNFYDFLHEWLGTGLLTSTGKKWKTRRRIITPTFHFAILNNFSSVFQRQAQVLVSKLKPSADTDKAIDIQVPVGLCALDIICETAMGVCCNAQGETKSDYVNAVLAMSGFIQDRQKTPYLWPNLLYSISFSGRKYKKCLNTILNFTNKVIKDRIELRNSKTSTIDPEKDSSKKIAFLDMLLDNYVEKEIDFEGIREEVDTFMFEGHDTTAAAMSWTLFLLGHHPDIQAELHKEIDTVTDDGSDDIVEKVKQLKLLEAVVKEALRLYPSVCFFGRTIDGPLKAGDKVVPAGTNVAIFTYGLHRNLSYWDDPDKFKPERFLSEDFAKRHPYQYVPFSAGSRNCVGQKFAYLEEKVVLFHVLKNYRVTSVQAIDDVHLCAELITRSNNGLWVKLYKR